LGVGRGLIISAHLKIITSRAITKETRTVTAYLTRLARNAEAWGKGNTRTEF